MPVAEGAVARPANPKLVIWGLNASTHTQRVIVACNELDLPFELRVVDVREDPKPHKSEQYMKQQVS